MLFSILVSIVIAQRLIELFIAKQNQKWAEEHGGIEYGRGHYKYIVMLHVAFFVSLIIEHFVKPSLIPGWYLFFIVFLAAQCLRVWSLMSLGKHWNTRVIVIPNKEKVVNGPYRFLKHPNYVVVTLELFTLPFMFEAYITAFSFTILNIFFLFFVRIPVEEEALRHLPNPELK